MTVVLALTPPQRPRALHAGPLRLAVFDSSVLTSDIIAATRRGQPSSFVAGMRDGTLRGFITTAVWAQVPRVLEDRWNEGEEFILPAALRLWWNVYVPLLYTVCTDRLPMTPQAEQLEREDASDVGMLQLHAVLGPAALISQDKDLKRSGFAHPDWPQVRRAVGQVGVAEQQTHAAVQVGTLAVEGTAQAVIRAARLAWDHPWAALVTAGVLVGGFLIYRRHHGPVSLATAKPFVETVGRVIVEQARLINERYDRGETVWADAERGSTSADMLHRVARVLACAPEPLTRTEILAAVTEFPGRIHADRMFGLYALLRTYPMFCEVTPHHWQVGRADVGLRLN